MNFRVGVAEVCAAAALDPGISASVGGSVLEPWFVVRGRLSLSRQRNDGWLQCYLWICWEKAVTWAWESLCTKASLWVLWSCCRIAATFLCHQELYGGGWCSCHACCVSTVTEHCQAWATEVTQAHPAPSQGAACCVKLQHCQWDVTPKG